MESTASKVDFGEIESFGEDAGLTRFLFGLQIVEKFNWVLVCGFH